MALPIVASGLALVALFIAASLRDWRWLFFGCIIAGVSIGAWIFHFTRIPAFSIAPPVIFLLYATPLRRVRLFAGTLGGVALGVLFGELWAMILR